MFNYRITIQYDGTDFYGWQSQPSGNTVQDELTSAIKKITSETVSIIGSGRTDSGVHALGQVANFKLENSVDEYKFLHSLNSVLPQTIALKDIIRTDDGFHSRFDASERSYIYLIGKQKSPFYERYSYQYSAISSIDMNQLNSISRSLIGKHDFTSFCKTGTETENKICDVKNIHWRESNGLVLFYISANRFLHGMVRTTVGTLLKALREEDENYLISVLHSKNRANAGESLPAKGLFLFKVKY